MPNNKDLQVLNDCVDSRNGKRFTKGQYFDPVPTGEQAHRLVLAKCLPVGAIKLGEAEDARLAKRADEEAAVAEKMTQRNSAIAAAVDVNERAKIALDHARAELAAATTDADKAAAAAKVTEAEEAAAKATAALEKAQK